MQATIVLREWESFSVEINPDVIRQHHCLRHPCTQRQLCNGPVVLNTSRLTYRHSTIFLDQSFCAFCA